LKNKINFIPKNYSIKPDYYKNCFGAWRAVFLVNNEIYNLQLVVDIYNNPNNAKGIEILKQYPTCRSLLHMFYETRFKWF